MSRPDLATAAGVSSEYIRKLEKGQLQRPSMEFLTKIAVVFGLQAQDLLDEDFTNGQGKIRDIAGADWETREIRRLAPTVPIEEARELLDNWENLDAAGRRAVQALIDGLLRAKQKRTNVEGEPSEG